MIQVIPSKQRHFSDFGWLQTYWLFSFSDYYDPANLQFGSLRVFNDDIVMPGKGFDDHDHAEMEIITLVTAGELTHTDSLGHTSILKPRDVQVMSAGTGLTHSEYNRGSQPVHLFQIWIMPQVRGLRPSYSQKNFAGAPANELVAIASGKNIQTALPLNTPATVYWGNFTEANAILCSVNPKHGSFIYVISGQVDVNGIQLAAGDQARITHEETLRLRALSNSEIIFIDTHLG